MTKKRLEQSDENGSENVFGEAMFPLHLPEAFHTYAITQIRTGTRKQIKYALGNPNPGRAYTEVSGKFKEVEGHLPESRILDGKVDDVDYVFSLGEQMVVLETEEGDTIAAATEPSLAYKEKNEDRVLVDPENGLYAAMDGIGSGGYGDVAAEIIAEELKANPGRPGEAARKAANRLYDAKKSLPPRQSHNPGATVAGGRIVQSEGKKYLQPFACGDSAVVVYDTEGKAVFHSEVENYGYANLGKGFETEEEICGNQPEMFSRLTAAITASSGIMTQEPPPVELKPGYTILIVTDGIVGNLVPFPLTPSDTKPNEIWPIIKDKTPGDAVRELGEVTDKRMGRSFLGDNFRLPASRDNKGVVLIKVG